MGNFVQKLSTVFFFAAILHTFFVSKIERIAAQYPKKSIAHNIFHLLAEVEVVFGIWSFLFLLFYFLLEGQKEALQYIESLNFNESLFVFVIMTMAATRPIIVLAEKIIFSSSKLLPFSERMNYFAATMIIGPLLGSLITEPASMTVTALILLNTIFSDSLSLRLKYASLALLFVNVSLGGTLTHFAAPPVLMVASAWKWDTPFMLKHFGVKALISIVFSTLIICLKFKNELSGTLKTESIPPKISKSFAPLILIHVLLLFGVVYFSHHPIVFILLFLFFLGIIFITKKDQAELNLKQSLLVGIFLAGLVILGTLQAWWLRPLLAKMNETILFFGATALTAITDNAALTYLGTLVDLGEYSRYALVAGAVAGGGLTVIANAPNPVGFGILRESFGREGINPFRLFLYAMIPTAISILCLLA